MRVPRCRYVNKHASRHHLETHFFLPPPAASCFCSHETTFPSITTPLPSMKATRDKPSQFLNESATRGCCGWNTHSAISLDFRECGSSIFFPPVSLPIFHTILAIPIFSLKCVPCFSRTRFLLPPDVV